MFLSSLLATLVWSCSKDETRDYFKGGTAPELTATTNNASGTSISLAYADAATQAIALEWTNPNYQFTTGISSQDVYYTVEIDTTGANFTNPLKKQIVVPQGLSLKIQESELNDYLLNQLALQPGVEHALEFRVVASLKGGTVPLSSNVVKLTATPYSIPPKVQPPASGKLYITGSATPGNWMGGGDAELLSQKFTQVSPTQYEIIITLTGGNSYTFVPVYGDWSNKYSIAVKNDPNEIYGGDFQAGGNDILAPAATGVYKIVVDFQRGKFTVTQQ